VKNFIKTVKRGYKTSPAIVRLLLRPAFWAYHALRKTYGVLRPCVWALKSAGQNEGSGGLLFCGDAGDKNYIVRMTFAGGCAQTEMGRLWVWQVIRLIRSRACGLDFLMYDVPLRLSGLLGRRRCFCLPLWAHGDLDSSLIDFKSRSLKEDIRKIRNKYAYTFEVTADRAGLKFFYDEMYVPYAKAQYGEELILDDFEDMVQAAENMEVLWIIKEGVRVAGMCFYYKEGKATLKSMGVLKGDEELVKSGAIQAMYYYMTNHLKDKGYSRAGVGGSRPFFTDGVLNFKKKWGLRLTRCQSNVIRVYPLRDTRWARNFVITNPCITLEGNDFVGMAFVEKDGKLTDEDIKGYARYLWPGLKRFVLYSFGGTDPDGASASAGEPGVVVRPAKELFD
jgi:hypothetical protein